MCNCVQIHIINTFVNKSHNFNSHVVGTPRKPESPAYTLQFNLGIPNKTPIDIDLVPAIRIEGWPNTAREVKSGTWIDDDAAKKAMQCFYLVTKRYPGGINLFITFPVSNMKTLI